MRRRAAILAGVLGVLAVPAGAQAADFSLTEARGAKFPDRSYVVRLPAKRDLRDGDISVRENGQHVENVKLSQGGASGAVLVIDASNSMHGDSILDAMAAARAFAAQRRPDQPLGVVFFSREPHVALEPTTDKDRIDGLLATPPELSKGTRALDAAAKGIELLRAADVSAGSVFVLSDGADVGSRLTPAIVAGAARKAEVAIHTIGLRSPSFDRKALSGLARRGGGLYSEASSSRRLKRIFDKLGERFGNEYLVRYRSFESLGSNVRVTAAIDGLAGTAVAEYTAPLLPPPPPLKAVEAKGWASDWVPGVIAGLTALFAGLAVFLVLRPAARTVSSRIEGFVAPASQSEARTATAPIPILVDVDRSLGRIRWWGRFKQEVDVARIDMPPIRIALATLAGTVAWAMLWGGLVGHIVLALFALAIPPAVWVTVRVLAQRQRRLFDDQLADNLQVIASAMRAGHSFVNALDVVTDGCPEPSLSELRRVVLAEQLGKPLHEAIGESAQRMDSPDFEYVGIVASLTRQTGGNTAEVLDRVGKTIRERAEVRRLVRTLTAQGRLGGTVISVLPVALFAFLLIREPHFLDPLFERTAGVILLVMAAVMVCLGWYVIRKIVDIKV